MTNELTFQIIQWIGIAFIFASYVFISLTNIHSRKLFQILNLLGGLCLAVSSFFLKILFLMIIGIAWAIISVVTMTKLFKPNKEYKDWTY